MCNAIASANSESSNTLTPFDKKKKHIDTMLTRPVGSKVTNGPLSIEEPVGLRLKRAKAHVKPNSSVLVTSTFFLSEINNRDQNLIV